MDNKSVNDAPMVDGKANNDCKLLRCSRMCFNQLRNHSSCFTPGGTVINLEYPGT
jgi:hypothetical protein